MSNFDRGGRKARAGFSPSLGKHDPRQRGNAVHGRTGDDLGRFLTLDRDGRQTIDIDEKALTVTPEGKLSLNKDVLKQAVSQVINQSTTVIGGGGGGGGGDTTIINNTFLLDDTLTWIGW